MSIYNGIDKPAVDISLDYLDYLGYYRYTIMVYKSSPKKKKKSLDKPALATPRDRLRSDRNPGPEVNSQEGFVAPK